MPLLPSTVHFIWLGSRLPPLPYLALRAALDRSGAEAVWLHTDTPALADDPLVADLRTRPGFALHLLNLTELLEGLPPALAHIAQTLKAPPGRANLFRLLLLWRYGGIYLDTDAITLRDLTPLREEAGFAGLERVVFPAQIHDSRNPLSWLRAGTLTVVRDIVRRLYVDAGAAFKRIEELYPLTTNNAALGAMPHHPFIGALLDRVSFMTETYALRRYRLGPQLLERVGGNVSRPYFRLFPTWAFYPLPPEISMVYAHQDPAGRFGDRPHPDTFAAHVYDSVLAKRLGRPLDTGYFRETRGRTLLARMVEPYLDDLFAASAG